MKVRIKTEQQTVPPVIAEISAKSTDHELTTFRNGITRSASEQEWQAAAIALFTRLGARGARTEVRKLGRQYNKEL